ncbi:MAG TPA: GNAT family N-acetyltransferase [Phycisphaerae bacterium]|nr:GNAT family N-acetyltransferase [Phycisphaerae bacterium]
MRIDVITEAAGMDRIAARWHALYAADPHAHYFVSWSWLRNWFAITPYTWFVLAARPADDADYVAFLPLARTAVRRCGVGLQQSLYMGGKPISDYAGFVADPAHADAALAALGRHIAGDSAWNWFHVGHVPDPRLDALLAGLSGANLRITPDADVSCPFVELPADWDEYLATRLSHKGRFNLRRYTRMTEELPEFRATVTSAETADRDIDVVLTMWQDRWGALASADAGNYRTMLHGALADGDLWLRMLWAGETPIAGAAGFLDRVHRRFCYYIGGYNPEFNKLSPGKVVVGYALRDTIAAECTFFDFLLGGEGYKMDFFGASERPARGATIMRMDVASRMRRRLARWLAHAPVVSS